MKPRHEPRFLFDEVGFRADMEAFHAHLRAQPRPYVRLKPRTAAEKYQADVDEERSDGWALVYEDQKRGRDDL